MLFSLNPLNKFIALHRDRFLLYLGWTIFINHMYDTFSFLVNSSRLAKQAFLFNNTSAEQKMTRASKFYLARWYVITD